MRFDRIVLGCWLADWGNRLGALFVTAPIIYDTLGLGFRGFIHWNIGRWGMICQLIGVGIILLTRSSRDW